MKYPDKNIDFRITQLDFILTPLEITFAKTQAHTYALQLGKGPQIYKKFHEHLWVHASERTHKFAQHQSATFKLQNQKSMVCEWSLYKITDEDLNDFMCSMPADLSKYYGTYIQKLKKHSKEYMALHNSQLVGQQIAKEWENLKADIPHQFQLQCKNHQLQVDLLCRLQIKCEMDRLVEQQLIRAKVKKLAKTHSKNSASFSSRKSMEEQTHNLHSPRIVEAAPPDSQTQYTVGEIKIIHHQPVVRVETLSDIQQVSIRDQYSSNRNYDEKNKHSVLSEAVDEIPEEAYEPTSPLHPSIRTQNFDKLKIMEEIDNFKRNRSYTSDLNVRRQNETEPHLDDSYNVQEEHQEHSRNHNEEYRGGKSEIEQGMETAPQSQLRPQDTNSEELPLKSNIEEPLPEQSKPAQHCLKTILILLLLLALSFASLQEITGRKRLSQMFVFRSKQKTAKREEKKSKASESIEEEKPESRVKEEKAKIEKKKTGEKAREQHKSKENGKVVRGQSKQKAAK